jgi:ppGpp synthetase/RelA/SpoT-type nucleotidyltranferase
MVLPIQDPQAKYILAQLKDILYKDTVASIVKNSVDSNLETAILEGITRLKDKIYSNNLFNIITTTANSLTLFYDWLANELEETGLKVEKDYILLDDGMGYAEYGKIILPSGKEIEASFSVRVKDYGKLISKIASNVINKAVGKPIREEIHDYLACRVIVGKTDRELYPRKSSKLKTEPSTEPEKFNHTSVVLDQVVTNMTGGDRTIYSEDGNEPSEDIQKLVKVYNSRINRLIQEYESEFYSPYAATMMPFQAYSYRQTFEHLLKISKRLAEKENANGEYILEEHLEELALQRVINLIIIKKYGAEDDLYRDYVDKPRVNGYSAVHNVIRHGLANVEVQIRTGLQHICSSHGPHWGHKAYEADDKVDSALQRQIGEGVSQVLPAWNLSIQDGILPYFAGIFSPNAFGVREVKFL